MNIDNINNWAGKIKSQRMTQAQFCEENNIDLGGMRKLMYSANDLSAPDTSVYCAVEQALGSVFITATLTDEERKGGFVEALKESEDE